MAKIQVPSSVGSGVVSSPTGETISKQLLGVVTSVIASVNSVTEYITDGTVSLLNISRDDKIIMSGFANAENNGEFKVKKVEDNSLFLINTNGINDGGGAFTFNYSVRALHVSSAGGGTAPSCTGSISYPPEGTNFTDATMCDIFFSAGPPILTVTGLPPFGLREIGDDVVNPTIRVSAAQGSNSSANIDYLRWLRNGLIVQHLTSPLSYGTDYDFNDTITISVNSTYKMSVMCDDGQFGVGEGDYWFVYPFYATTVGITTLTKQTLQSGAIYFQATMVAENTTDKFKMDLTHVLTGVEIYNVFSGTWEWMAGSKANSLTLWTQSNVNHTVQGNIVAYNRYTHNGLQTGSAQLRFWVV